MQIVHLSVVDNWFARPVSEKLLMARSNMPVQLWLAEKCLVNGRPENGCPFKKYEFQIR